MHPAATVIVLRELGGELEALLMRRGPGLAFMADTWVFPGGRVDTADIAPAMLGRILPASRSAGRGRLCAPDGAPLGDDVALALYVAACRETFEESGVLLARERGGMPCDTARTRRLQGERLGIARDASGFVALLEREDLYLDLAPLVYWSHWITPSLEPKRFDTRFFAVAVPPDQEASADAGELTDHAWIRPARVHEAIADGRMRVVPPTLLTLEDLAESHARHGSLAAMLAAERDRPTPPVLPRIERDGDAYRVVMPWDAGYGAIEGEGCQPESGYPPHLLRRRSSLTMGRGPAAR